MKTRHPFPRVAVPGVDQDQAQAVREILAEAQAQEEHRNAQKAGMVLAMIRLGKRPSQRTSPDLASRRSRALRKAHR